MEKTELTEAQRIVQAASDFQQRQTGHTPTRVTAVLGEGTLVITLRDALSPAEMALLRTPAGAAEVREFHRTLFANSSDSLRQEINKITGMKVHEATAEVVSDTGAVIQAFTSGTVVQVFLLAGNGVGAGTRSGSGRDGQT